MNDELKIPELHCVNCEKQGVLVPTGKKRVEGTNTFYEFKCPDCGHEYEFKVEVKNK